MPVGRVLDTTETGSQSAGHEVLQRSLAGYSLLASQTSYGNHHGLGATRADPSVRAVLPKAVLSDETALTGRSVLCGQIDVS
jgi:hypothetical protein